MTEALGAAGLGTLLGAVLLFVPALVLTLIVEIPVAALMGLRTKRALVAVVLVNLITNPLVNFVVLAVVWSYSELFSLPLVYWGIVALLEVLVVIAEWRLLLWALGGSSRRMLASSVAMNTGSFGIGLLILGLYTVGLLG